MKMFPVYWIFYYCVKKTSYATVKARGEALYHSKFLQYIGIWLLLGTSVGWTHADHWNTSPHSQQEHPYLYKLSPLMRRKRFEEITRELKFTSSDCFVTDSGKGMK